VVVWGAKLYFSLTITFHTPSFTVITIHFLIGILILQTKEGLKVCVYNVSQIITQLTIFSQTLDCDNIPLKLSKFINVSRKKKKRKNYNLAPQTTSHSTDNLINYQGLDFGPSNYQLL
jgi:hypothetical protein